MPQKVLIIDDSLTTQRIVQMCLRDEHLELLFASTGTDGINLACSASPDLILLDIEMPSPNGFDVCRQLKALEATASIPIVFLTRFSLAAEKVQGLDLGAVDYVTKPFEATELCARVRAALRNKYMLDLLSQKAMIDGLTGLWNRAYLDQRLAQEIALAKRSGGTLSVIVADVDEFKSINDTHGHPFGDKILRDVAQLLASCCRSEDIVCRYGGDEFVILTPQVALAGAMVLAERARQTIYQQVLTHRNTEVRFTCSFGVAELDPVSEASLLETADDALYQAKRNGRNRVASYQHDRLNSVGAA